jgi:hypothetical protein
LAAHFTVDIELFFTTFAQLVLLKKALDAALFWEYVYTDKND